MLHRQAVRVNTPSFVVYPLLVFSSRNLEPFVREELAEYIKFAGLMKQKIPTEFEKFLGKPDFEVLGSVLAMQVSL